MDFCNIYSLAFPIRLLLVTDKGISVNCKTKSKNRSSSSEIGKQSWKDKQIKNCLEWINYCPNKRIAKEMSYIGLECKTSNRNCPWICRLQAWSDSNSVNPSTLNKGLHKECKWLAWICLKFSNNEKFERSKPERNIRSSKAVAANWFKACGKEINKKSELSKLNVWSKSILPKSL